MGKATRRATPERQTDAGLTSLTWLRLLWRWCP